MRKRTVLFSLLILLFVETAYCGETGTHNLITIMLFKRIPYTGTYADDLYKDYNALDWDWFNDELNTPTRRNKVYDAIVPDYTRYNLFALAYAAYLAIDSTDSRVDTLNRAKRAYNHLNGFLGGTMVPLNDFITGGNAVSKHKYTHQGWDHDYYELGGDNPLRWKLKKEIICSTIRQVFGLTDTEKIDSLGAVLYYSHLLADLRWNNTPEPAKNFLPHTSVVCEELEKHLARLFPNQDYRNLLNEIKKASLDSKTQNIPGSKLYPYALQAGNVLKALLYHFPLLLEKETWYQFKPNGLLENPKNANLD